MATNTFWHEPYVSRDDRERLNGHKGCVVWFTGLSGAGKSTLAHTLDRRLFVENIKSVVLDGDNVRHGLCSDLGFSPADRYENVRRIGEMARLFVQTGIVTLAAFISPYRADRSSLRERIGAADFIEVYCRCTLAECERRDRKGIYRKARAGEISAFTGISAPYEEPLCPDIALDTDKVALNECADRVHALLEKRGILSQAGVGRAFAPGDIGSA